MSTCRSCGAPITWARHAGGKAIPLNPNPTPTGNIIDGPDGAVVYRDHAQARSADPKAITYVSHFATCPDAATHRKPRTPEPDLFAPSETPG